MPNLTTNFSFNKPLVNNASDADLWGGQLNTNWDDADALLPQTTSPKASDFSVGSDEFNYTYLVDASGGAVTADLPTGVFAGFVVRFKLVDATNSLTLDPDGSETIDGAATYVLSGEDQTIAIVYDGSNWQILQHLPNSSEAVAGVVEKATKAELEGETADKNVTADNAYNHPSAAKAWGVFDCTSGTVSGFDAEYNCDTVTEISAGLYQVTLDNAMASDDYVVVASGKQSVGIGGACIVTVDVLSATVFRINCQNQAGSQRDSKVWFTVYGTLA